MRSKKTMKEKKLVENSNLPSMRPKADLIGCYRRLRGRRQLKRCQSFSSLASRRLASGEKEPTGDLALNLDSRVQRDPQISGSSNKPADRSVSLRLWPAHLLTPRRVSKCSWPSWHLASGADNFAADDRQAADDCTVR